MDIAVLGMGRMGQALAKRLLGGGHRVVVWNRTPGRAEEVVAAGATEAGSVAEAVKAAGAVITSLTADEAVRAVALGEGGVRAALGAEAVYADASTVSPAMSEELAAAFRRFVAMPILGPPAGVESGQAVYLAGGDPAAVERLEPVLAALSETVRRYDTAGKAMSAKLASNLLLLAGVAALAEAFAVARSGGVTDEQIRELLGGSAMVAPGVRNRFEGVLAGDMEPWWSTALGAKDARLAAEAAAGAGVELPLARTVAGLYDEVATAGAEDEDIVAVARRYVPGRSGG
jgi:3-hydroxyisobutyrate dehydrogenase-like beta-hydroxyacid dehydrogenase